MLVVDRKDEKIANQGLVLVGETSAHVAFSSFNRVIASICVRISRQVVVGVREMAEHRITKLPSSLAYPKESTMDPGWH